MADSRALSKTSRSSPSILPNQRVLLIKAIESNPSHTDASSIPSLLYKKNQEEIRNNFHFQPNMHLYYPIKLIRANNPPTDKTAVYVSQLEIGLRFPLMPLCGRFWVC
ncbi:hypothetical protein ACH5RR_013176 [Cinchona calisaya]|uniref:Uncharacterized protein n=1 Tax=Cinchona calisaya TaxID=153742 RepID=A0ABD2ZZA2_9GENT